MDNRTYEVWIIRPDEYKHFAAQIHYRSKIWAEVNQEHGELSVEFNYRPQGEPMLVPIDVAVAALNEAKRKLLDGQPKQ